MSEKTNISDETLDKFDALENVKSAQRIASDDDLTVDTTGLLAVSTPLNEPAVQLENALGKEKVSSAIKRKIPHAPLLFQRARHWTQDPAKLWVIGLTCVIAAGLLTFIVLMLTDSI